MISVQYVPHFTSKFDLTEGHLTDQMMIFEYEQHDLSLLLKDTIFTHLFNHSLYMTDQPPARQWITQIIYFLHCWSPANELYRNIVSLR